MIRFLCTVAMALIAGVVIGSLVGCTNAQADSPPPAEPEPGQIRMFNLVCDSRGVASATIVASGRAAAHVSWSNKDVCSESV